jgi:putative membrane protein
MPNYVAGLPAFLSYFLIGLVCLAAFSAIYTRLTPHSEGELIKAGNIAAVVAFLGALIGFSQPQATAAANSVSLPDYVVWAVIGLLVQIFAFYLAKLSMTDLHLKIIEDNVAAGLWSGGIAVVIGILNAACMAY